MAEYYYPEGPLGPICDVILPDDFRIIADPAPAVQDLTQVIDGPRDPNAYVFWPLSTECKVDPVTGELYDCETVYEKSLFDLSPYNGTNNVYDGADGFDWANFSTQNFGLNDEFFIPIISPDACFPFDPDINIRPVRFYDDAGIESLRYACEKSTPVTYAVHAGSKEAPVVSVRFNDDATQLIVEGSGEGEATFTLEWNDDPNTFGVALDSLTIGGVTWSRAGESGSETHTITIQGGQNYPITYINLNPVNIPPVINGSSICFRDSDGNDCNATFSLSGDNFQTEGASLWSELGDTYGVWTNNMECTLPCIEQTVSYVVNIPETDNYHIEFGADWEGELYLDNSETPILDITDGIRKGTTPHTSTQSLTAGDHLFTVKCINDKVISKAYVYHYFDTNVDWGTITPGPGTAIRQELDGYDNQTNSISASFPDAYSISIGGSGIGVLNLLLSWNDDPNAHGTALGSVEVYRGGTLLTTLTQNTSQSNGSTSSEIDVTAGETLTISYVNILRTPSKSNDTQLCYKDSHEDDCNATLTIVDSTSYNYLNEVGGFSVPSDSPSKKYLSFGTIEATTTTVFNRSATITGVDLRGAEIIQFTVIAGSDYNGGERPNDLSDIFEVNVNNTGWVTICPSKQSAGLDFTPYDNAYGYWRDVNLTIPVAARIDNATIQFRSGGDIPEVGGEYLGLTSAQFEAAYANSGDVFGIYRIGFVYANDEICFDFLDEPVPSAPYDVAARGYYKKNMGDWSYSTEGKAKELWNDDSEYVEAEFEMTGGSGSGMVLLIRLEPWPKPFLKQDSRPGNTRYKVIRVVESGTGYRAGDVLNFNFTTPRRTSLGLGTTSFITPPIKLTGINTQEDSCGCINQDSYIWTINPGGWFVRVCQGGPCAQSDVVEGWVRSGPHQGWGNFMNAHSVWVSNHEARSGETHSATYSITTIRDDTLQLTYTGDNTIEITFDGVQVANLPDITQPYYQNSYTTSFSALAGNHTLVMTVHNEPKSSGNNSWTNNPAGGAWLLSYSNGDKIRSSDELESTTGGNVVWHTRLSTGYRWSTSKDCST